MITDKIKYCLLTFVAGKKMGVDIIGKIKIPSIKQTDGIDVR